MNAYDYLFAAAALCLAAGLFFALLRAIRGPRVADRIMGINMIGTIVSLTLAILSVWLRQSWLLDVCILYALISFLAVVVLAKVCIAAKKQEVDDDV
ncbi:MAG: sodium:proton antiporter [Ruminococcaceae bacterium]|jgi:Multisubunit Na+/H+ antiporter, MnhF subunit|nr:sodium:proton antiporter [Oscillospiraceae bacterium]